MIVREDVIYIMNVMFFVVTSNTLDSNQKIIFMIKKDFLELYSMTLYHRLPTKLGLKCNFF